MEIQKRLIELFFVALLAIMSWMAVSINHISESLAVVVYKIQDHEGRIGRLENVRNR